MAVVRKCDYHPGSSWYIETLDGYKIAALQNGDVITEARTLEAKRCVLYKDEMEISVGHSILTDIPQVNIIHEWREDEKLFKTIYHKAFLLEIPKQYSLTGGLLIIQDLKYEYEIREEIRK